MKHTVTASIILLLLLSLTCLAHAELTPARICIGTREAIVSPPAVFDGTKVYAPLGLLNSLGVTHSADKPGEITITNAVGRSGEMKTVLVNGTQMMLVEKMAEVIGLGFSWDAAKRTVVLTAKLESVEFEENTLKVNCTIPISYKISPWDGGGKLIVDISSTRLATPANEVFVGSSLVTRVRLGQTDDNTSRVVLDLEKPVSHKTVSAPLAAKIELQISERIGPAPTPSGSQTTAARPFEVSGIRVEPLDDSRFQVVLSTTNRGAVTPAFSAKPAKITLNLANCTLDDVAMSYTGDHELINDLKITRNAAARKATVELSLKRTMIYDTRVDENSITMMFMPPAKSGGKLSDKLIVIDPGHGNLRYGKIDPGARYGGVNEKDINLATAKELSAILEAEGARVIMTRTADNGVEIAARPLMAVNSGADFFISIHCNATGKINRVSGVETYYHKNELSPRLLAEAIQNSVCAHTGMCDLKARSDTRLYASGLGVLRGLAGSGIPGVLLECGYLDHDSDRAKLSTPAFRKKLAQAVASALKDYVEGK